MHSSIPLVILITLLSLLAIFAPPDAAVASTEYLIVTTDALAPSFQDLANQKAAQGYQAQILTVEQIQLMEVPGRDLAEQIRNAIIDVHQGGSLGFVLLGGDAALIPARLVYNDFYPGGGTEIPTDLYYSALDGDWDADGDGVFGEVGVDAADLDPEVAVGRVPAASSLEAAQYAAKVSQYEDPANAGHLDSALLLDEVLFPSDWQPEQPISLDGALFGEEFRAIVQGGADPLAAERLYENHFGYPGSNPLTRLEVVAALDAGTYGVVQHAGHGYEASMSVGDDVLGPADALGLTNGPRYFVLTSSIARGAAFDRDVILEDFVRNPDGGAVATIGFTRASFPATSHAYLGSLYEELFLQEVPTLGEAMAAVWSARAADAQGNTVERYIHLSLTLLGDPELGVGDGMQGVVGAPAATPTRVVLHSAAPNPFNPSVTIRFELLGAARSTAAVTVAIYDAAGRKIRTVWQGPLETGPHDMVWNGRDDAGRELSSGTYFATVEHAGERHATKMSLLK